MIWENGIETCTLSYVKQIASPGSMHDTGCSGLVNWDDPEGSDGEGGGRGVQDGEHMYTHGGFMSMYGKTIKDCKENKYINKTEIIIIINKVKKKKRLSPIYACMFLQNILENAEKYRRKQNHLYP